MAGILQIRKIDKRLKACHNLLLDPDSQAHKDAAAAKASREADKRRKKVCLSSCLSLSFEC